jgi:hypothetical protein
MNAEFDPGNLWPDIDRVEWVIRQQLDLGELAQRIDQHHCLRRNAAFGAAYGLALTPALRADRDAAPSRGHVRRRADHPVEYASKPSVFPKRGNHRASHRGFKTVDESQCDGAIAPDDLDDGTSRHPPSAMHARAILSFELSDRVAHAHQDECAPFRRVRPDVVILVLQADKVGTEMRRQ